MTRQEHNTDGIGEHYVTKSGTVVDPKRFGKADRFFFAPFDVQSMAALTSVMERKELANDNLVIVAEVNGGHQIGFATEQLAYHHVAQGSINGEPWMVSF